MWQVSLEFDLKALPLNFSCLSRWIDDFANRKLLSFFTIIFNAVRLFLFVFFFFFFFSSFLYFNKFSTINCEESVPLDLAFNGALKNNASIDNVQFSGTKNSGQVELICLEPKLIERRFNQIKHIILTFHQQRCHCFVKNCKRSQKNCECFIQSFSDEVEAKKVNNKCHLYVTVGVKTLFRFPVAVSEQYRSWVQQYTVWVPRFICTN